MEIFLKQIKAKLETRPFVPFYLFPTSGSGAGTWFFDDPKFFYADLAKSRLLYSNFINSFDRSPLPAGGHRKFLTSTEARTSIDGSEWNHTPYDDSRYQYLLDAHENTARLMAFLKVPWSDLATSSNPPLVGFCPFKIDYEDFAGKHDVIVWDRKQVSLSAAPVTTPPPRVQENITVSISDYPHNLFFEPGQILNIEFDRSEFPQKT